jgi:uncharacterized delta-60 repeat protein
VIAGTGTGNGGLNFAAVRLRRDGSLDSSFGNGGIATVAIGGSAIANAVSIQPGDGKIVLAGTALVSPMAGRPGHNEFAVARLNGNGAIDTSFGTSGTTTLSPPAAAWGMVRQSDGKFVLAGQEEYNGTSAYMAARVLPDGAVDSGFGNGGIVTVPIGSNAIGDAIALQGNGKLILAGSAYIGNAVTATTVRLGPNGSLDRGYGSGGIASIPYAHAINAVTVDAQARILLAGTGATAVRLKPDGSADQSFGSSGIFTAQLGTSADAANGVTIQPADGKIVLSGVAHVGGRAVLSVVRLSG